VTIRQAQPQKAQRVTIQTQTVSTDSYGEAKRTYSTSATVWAFVETLFGRSLERAKSLQAEINTRVVINYDDFPTIDDTMRIVYGSRRMDIKYVPIVADEERPLDIEIYCQEITGTPLT
jgi:SPP1 family predicted phage head-tail adaptor